MRRLNSSTFYDKSMYKNVRYVHNDEISKLKAEFRKKIDYFMKPFVPCETDKNSRYSAKEIKEIRSFITSASDIHCQQFGNLLKTEIMKNSNKENNQCIDDSGIYNARNAAMKEYFGSTDLVISVLMFIKEDIKNAATEIENKRLHKNVGYVVVDNLINGNQGQHNISLANNQNNMYNYNQNPQYPNCKYSPENLNNIQNQINSMEHEKRNEFASKEDEKRIEKMKRPRCCTKDYCSLM